MNDKKTAQYICTKGQLISKGKFSVFNSTKQTNLKMLIFALVYWGKKISFVFWDNWKKKVLSKSTNLYLHRMCIYGGSQKSAKRLWDILWPWKKTKIAVIRSIEVKRDFLVCIGILFLQCVFSKTFEIIF